MSRSITKLSFLPKSFSDQQKRGIHHPFFEKTKTSADIPIYVGFIGAGTNTKEKHIPNLKAIPGVELAAVSNRSRASSEAVAKQFNIPKVCNHWQDILKDPSIDAVVIGTWPNMHKTITCAALEQNKHVLCEARMAMNAKEAHEMVELATKKSHLVTQLVPSPYTLKYDQTIRNLIQNKFFGQLLAIDIRSVSGSFMDTSALLHWRQDIDKSGMNILSMGIFYEALMRWVGPASSVTAMTNIFVKQRKDPESGKTIPVQVPDHVDIIAEMACGAQARMQFSSVLGLVSPKAEISLYGSEGTLKLDLEHGQLYVGKKGEDKMTALEIPTKDQQLWRVEEEWVNAIRGNEKVTLTTFEDGVKYMEFTEAVWRSSTQKKTIALPLTVQ